MVTQDLILSTHTKKESKRGPFVYIIFVFVEHKRIFVEEMTDHLIIVAGGTGSRMGTDLPKQFLEINHKPILVHTLERFYSFDSSLNIIVVLHPDFVDYWIDLKRTLQLNIPHQVVAGGKERFFSVQNGLSAIQAETGVVGIHDAVRPLVSKKTFETSYHQARINGNAIPVLPLNDSLRTVEDGQNKIADRSKFRLVQTPQCFEISQLRKAFQQAYHPMFTDDASVVEALGVHLNLVEGNRENIKITTPEDLQMAQAYFTLTKEI